MTCLRGQRKGFQQFHYNNEFYHLSLPLALPKRPPSPILATVLGYAPDNLQLSWGPRRQEGHGKNPSVSICRIPEWQKPDPRTERVRAALLLLWQSKQPVLLVMHY